MTEVARCFSEKGFNWHKKGKIGDIVERNC